MDNFGCIVISDLELRATSIESIQGCGVGSYRGTTNMVKIETHTQHDPKSYILGVEGWFSSLNFLMPPIIDNIGMN